MILLRRMCNYLFNSNYRQLCPFHFKENFPKIFLYIYFPLYKEVWYFKSIIRRWFRMRNRGWSFFLKGFSIEIKGYPVLFFLNLQLFLSNMKLMLNDKVLLTHKTPEYLVYLVPLKSKPQSPCFFKLFMSRWIMVLLQPFLRDQTSQVVD